MIKEDYIGEFEDWREVYDYWARDTELENPLYFYGKPAEFWKQIGLQFNEWVETNYNHNPRFTVKSDRKTEESDRFDYQTIHQS